MPIENDWTIDYVNKEIYHVDGILSYDANAGTAPSLNDRIIGTTSGTVARVIAGSDLGGTNATGTLTLTDVTSRFQNNEPIEVLSEVPFDTVANGGFAVGDTITGPTTESIDVQFIEYNRDGLGTGTIWGDNLTTGFADGEQLDVSGGSSAVADVNGSETDNSGLFTSALVNGTLAVPGTANTNNSYIIHYDGGTIAIPEDAHIADATTGAEGFAQKVLGVTATGSIRVIDSDTTGGSWTDDNALEIQDVVFYDALVAGNVFSVGQVVVGATSTATGRVIAVIDDGDNTGKLILADKSGTFDAVTPDDLEVDGVKIAEVENTTFTLSAATLNLPNGVRTEQRTEQGGIFGTTVSLNIVRAANALYTWLQDTFDELAQLDDLPPLDGNVLDQLYLWINDWDVPDLSFRFLEKGAFRDSGNHNVYTNYRTILSGEDVTDNGWLYTATNPTPQPSVYGIQDGVVIDTTWLEGSIDVLVKNKTYTDTRYVNPAVPSVGQLIDNGTVTWMSRPYLRIYDTFETSDVSTVTTIPLDNKDDLNNNTGTHRITYTGTGGYTVGEEIVGGTTGAIGIVTDEDTVGDTLDYVLKTPLVQFGSAETITGGVSGATSTFSSVANLVAGYDSDIRVMTVDRRFTGGTTTVASYIIGEPITQTGSGATGFILEDDGGTLYVADNTGTFNGTGLITGDTSGALNTPSATAAFTTVPKDIGDGTGDTDFTAVISGDITDANAQPVLNLYEWSKYLTSREQTALLGGPGSAAGEQGRIYRRLVSTFSEVDAAPLGTFAGGKYFGAQGLFIDKDTLDAADLQNIELINNAGTTLNPPNLQTLQETGLVATARGAVYRSTGSGLETILRTEFAVGTVGGGNNQSADSTILVAASTRSVSPLPNDVPDTGVLYVEDPNNAGVYLGFPYSSVNRTTNIFTLTSGTIGAVTSSTDLTATDNAHVVFIRAQTGGTSLSNTVQYVADIPLYYVARLKGKKPFKNVGTFTATGANLSVAFEDDNVVNLP